MPTIRVETWVNASPERCFDLSRDLDLHTRSVAFSKERAVAGVTTRLIGPGESVTWEAVHFGIRQRLTSKITEYDRPRLFVDEQVRGAFKEFRHVHEFVPADGGTLIVDTFRYRSPLGPLGVIADKLFLERYMRKLLESRNHHIKQAAESHNG